MKSSASSATRVPPPPSVTPAIIRRNTKNLPAVPSRPPNAEHAMPTKHQKRSAPVICERKKIHASALPFAGAPVFVSCAARTASQRVVASS